MSLFQKRENFDIECCDRTIKNMIDKYYKNNEPKSRYYYEDKTAFFVEYGIKYFRMIDKWLEIEFKNHYSDASCDIPDYKTFLSLESQMLDNQDEYVNKTVCVEGYVAYGAFGTVNIYPVPCRSEVEEKSAFTLADFGAFYSIVLEGAQADEINYSLNRGTHIRVYGLVSPREDWDNVPIIIQRYEVLD